jgi:hypothetical protein
MVSIGYVLSALLLFVAAVTEWKLGIDAEGKSLGKHRESALQPELNVAGPSMVAWKSLRCGPSNAPAPIACPGGGKSSEHSALDAGLGLY